MNFIYLSLLFFALFLDTFISSHTNIPRTNNNNSKNATINKTSVDTIPDVITLEYIREQLKQIQLMKDEIIKDKLKKIKLLKQKSKKNKKDEDLKKDIEILEKEILDTRILCEQYIKNELKEISLIKDQIVKDKIENDKWKKDKLIDYELSRLFYEAKKKKLQQLYDRYLNKQINKNKENVKYKKHKRRSFYEIWSSIYDYLEERFLKYHIGSYTIITGLIAAIGKSVHSIYLSCTSCAAAVAKKASCISIISGLNMSCRKAVELFYSGKLVSGSANISSCFQAASCAKVISKAAACSAAGSSIEVTTIVVSAVIIIICVIALIALICLLVEKKETILENKYVQKIMPYVETIIKSKYISRIISGLNEFYLSKQLIYVI